MKVVFGCNFDESDVYEFPDNTSEIDLQEAADEWMRDNVGAYFDFIEDEEYEDGEDK